MEEIEKKEKRKEKAQEVTPQTRGYRKCKGDLAP
jgi:hypothetical protein